MRDTRDMAREVGIELDLIDEDEGQINWYITTEGMKAFEALARADERNKLAAWMMAQGYATGHGDTIEGLLEELEREIGFKRAELWIKRISVAVLAEREACAEKTGEFARKWWSIHCESNKHMETTLKAHQDFCALQSAIRARGQAS
jgi:hypothetical protein